MDYRVTIEPIEDRSSPAGQNVAAPTVFDPGVENITFGRDAADVVFPPESRNVGVGRRHGELRRQPSGDYVIEAYGDHYFEIDGYPATPGQNVRNGSTLRLGSPKGPLLRVRLERAEPKTKGNTTGGKWIPPSVWQVLERYGRYLIAVAAVLLVVIAGVVWIATRVPSIEDQVAALHEQEAGRANKEFSADEVGTLVGATYAVGIRRDGVVRPVGTAWPIDGGMLVTNAHVARLLPKPGSKDAMVVLNGGTTLIVNSVNIHPGYAAFQDYVEKGELGREFRAMTDGLATPSAYDVATLVVDHPDQMKPGLQLASADELAALKPGDALATAGFPIECTAAQPLATVTADPTPVFHPGNVTSITNYFLLRGEGTGSLLIQHSLPAAGGASGSPIVNAAGHVVAILSGGNIVVAGDCRAANAVMVNYGQRADLLEVVMGKASFDPVAEQEAWRKGLALFNAHENELVAEIARQLEAAAPGQGAGETSSEWTRLRGAGVVRFDTSRYREHTVEVEVGRTYAFMAYGGFGSSMNLRLIRGDQVIEDDSAGKTYATIVFTAEQTEVLTLRVVEGSAAAEGYTLHRFATVEPAAASATTVNPG